MASEEVPVAQEGLDEKLGDLKLEEPEKFEDTTDAPVEEKPEEQKEAVLEELKDSPPKLNHVETEDTTDPVAEPTTEDGVTKAEVPEAFAEELKTDKDIVPPAEETPTSTEAETEKKPTSKVGSFGDKISSKFHKLVGKE